MKLNQRDKILLIGVLVVLIWICGIMFFIKPAIESVSNASKTLDSKEMELDTLNAQIEEDKNLPQETQEAYDKAVETADVFYDKMLQFDAMTIVQGMLDDNQNDGKNQIKNSNLYITEMTTAALDRYEYSPDVPSTQIDYIIEGNTEEDGTATGAVAVTNIIDVNVYGMTFDFTCTKQALLTFITNLQTNSQKSIVVSELNIKDMQENKPETEIEGSISLSFMMLPDIMSPEEANQKAEEDVQEVNVTAEE